MKTEEKPTKIASDAVKKPASQYVLSISIGVGIVILLSVMAYYGIFQNSGL
jgi:hypothetical protein